MSEKRGDGGAFDGSCVSAQAKISRNVAVALGIDALNGELLKPVCHEWSTCQEEPLLCVKSKSATQTIDEMNRQVRRVAR